MLTQKEYDSYKAKNIAAIKKLLTETRTRPVLFLGCGITRRYLGSPSWMELLKAVALQAGIETEKFNYLAQKAANDPAAIGSALVDPIHEWAWTAGKNEFPSTYFTASVFIKSTVRSMTRQHSS